MEDNQGNRKRYTVGILAGWPAQEDTTPDHYIISVYQGIQAAAQKRGCNLLFGWGIGRGYHSGVIVPAWPLAGEDSDFVPVGPWNTDGLIVFAPLLNEVRSLYLDRIAAEGHPVVFIASGENGPAVLADNANGIHQAVAHLVDHGHQRIAFIAGDPLDMGDSLQRLNAFTAAVKHFNLDPDPRLIAFGNHNLDDSYNTTHQILDSGVSFTAILGSDDNSAIGAMRALKEAGLRIPMDVAVIGFDDQPDALAQIPPLTSVHVPLQEIGSRAFDQIYDFLDRTSRLDSVCVPTWLATRQSCGCLPDIVASAGNSRPFLVSPASGTAIKRNDKDQIIRHLAAQMLSSFPIDALQIRKNDAYTYCLELATAFFKSLEDGTAARFQQALIDFLHGLEQSEGDIHPWQEPISCLRREMYLFPANWEQIDLLRRAEDMLHAARVAISEGVQRRFLQNQYKQNASEYLLSDLNARLNTVTDERRAIALLKEKLPELGIRHTHGVLFESEDDDPVAWSVLISADNKTVREKSRFQSRQFPPPGLYPVNEILNLVILPLVYQNEALGYIAFDASNIKPCSAIARQFVANIKSARTHAEVVDLSLTDALTGLHNRRYFDLFLKSEIERCLKYDQNLTIIIVDIDHFKDYNDTFGHPAGDDALKLVSQDLLNNCRRADVVCRIGGEEFAIILTATGLQGALDVANKMRSAVANEAGLKCPLTLSLGITEQPVKELLSAETLLEQADQALYEAKRTGRNRVCVFEKSIIS